MYDEGIDLHMALRDNNVEIEGNVRVLGHVGADCIHVPILHQGVNGQRAPVRHSFAERE
jgi:phenylpropionate dioxygenase-like ring-hydroxylating dioxygenase large terminal subunit